MGREEGGAHCGDARADEDGTECRGNALGHDPKIGEGGQIRKREGGQLH